MTDGQGTGWRGRKREETGRRIGEAGFRLMAERGYEATTLDAIAEAAGISRRTFFHYFKSKEEVLLAWQDGFAERFRAIVLAQDGAATPLEALANAQVALVAGTDTEETRALDRVIRGSERLRAANQAKYLTLEAMGFEALCRLWPEPERRARLRAAAMAGVGAMRLAFEDWTADPQRRSLETHIRAAHAALAAEVAGPGLHSIGPKDGNDSRKA